MPRHQGWICLVCIFNPTDLFHTTWINTLIRMQLSFGVHASVNYMIQFLSRFLKSTMMHLKMYFIKGKHLEMHTLR